MFNQFRSRCTPFVLVGLIGISTLSLVGCGSGDSSNSVSTTSRHFTSTVALTSPQTAALDINVASDKTVTGTMTVTDPSRAARTRAVVVTVQLTGTIATNGDLTLTGTYTPTEGTAQTVRVTGNVGTSTGSVILNYLNQTFNGTWTLQGSVNPTGGGAAVTFSSVSSANATTTSRNLSVVVGANITLPGVGKQLTISASGTGTGDTTGTLSLSVLGGATVGTYTIDDNNYQVVYQEGPLGMARQWSASGGRIQIVSVDSSKVSFKIIGATMRAQSSLANPPAAGTFTVDATGETTALVNQ